MEGRRLGGGNDPSGSRLLGEPDTRARKGKKKARATRPDTAGPSTGPVPKPYLALAPSPISSLSPRRVDQLAAPSSSRSGLVLPSTINRTASTPNLAAGYQEAGRRGSAPNAQDVASGLVNNARVAAEGRRRGYAAGLMAPPTIMPGGTAAPPRTQGLAVPPQNPRKRSAERVGVGGSNTSPQIVTLSGTGVGSGSGNGIGRRRSEDRLRDIANLNSSMMSLGQLGRIMESDPPAEPATQAQPPERRRRRRVVRGEEGGLTRRPTVSSREEGRALGLARSASMRRTNVWDDLPESSDPPPAFPFPTTATTRLPPAFETQNASTSLDTTQRPSISTHSSSTAIPQPPASPPPSFEQAIGLLPLPHAPAEAAQTPAATPSAPQDPVETLEEQPSSRPSLTVTAPDTNVSPSTPSSPTSTQYASAPSSPLLLPAPVDDDAELNDREREDRRLWNADILAGYSLEDRVQREAARSKARDEAHQSRRESAASGVEIDTVPAAVTSTGAVLETRSPPSPVEKRVGPSPLAPERSTPTGETSSLPESSIVTGTETIPDTPATVVLATHQEPVVAEIDTAAKAGETSDDASLQPASAASMSSPPAEEPLRMSSEIVAVSTEPTAPSGSSSFNTQESPRQPTQHATEMPKAEIEPSGSEEPVGPVGESPVMSTPVKKSSKENNTRSSVTPIGSIGSNTPSRSNSIRAKRKSIRQPLFASKGLITGKGNDKGKTVPPWRMLEGSTTLAAEPSSATSNRSETVKAKDMMDRAQAESKRDVPVVAGLDREEIRRRRQERLLQQPKVSTPPPLEAQESPLLKSPTSPIEALPPHREAALKRRELAIKQSLPPAPPPKSPPALKARSPINIKPLLPSGPLIDLNDTWPSTSNISSSPDMEMRYLAASTAELLALFGGEEPVAESSAQAAAKAAAMAELMTRPEIVNGTPKASPHSSEVGSVKRVEDVKQKKVAPPPPISLKYRNSYIAGQGVSRKPSVLASADSPLTPRPSLIKRDGAQTPTPSSKGKVPALPTRRPPPPPPIQMQEDRPPSASSITPPSLPPRPSPPSFQPPQLVTRESYVSHTSSISDRPESPIKPAVAYRPRLRTSLSARPKGPRPPPIPPRPWQKSPGRPLYDATKIGLETRSKSENPLPVVEDDRSDITPPAPVRSMSAVDVRSEPTSEPSESREPEARSPIEYTDLDVLVSRLEGSGREYEGFSQITSFLGPGKNPAATPGALATVLPGLISVDSRRTTPQGKVKLKLSLLGVRVTKCPICLSQFREKDKAIMLPECGHVAHEVCSRRWFRENNKCFVCRAPLKEEEGVV